MGWGAGGDAGAGPRWAALFLARRSPPARARVGRPPSPPPRAGDLKSADVKCSFGFDTACKVYSEMIGNIMIDALSAKK